MSRKEETSKAKCGRRPDGKQRRHFVEESADQDDVYAMYHLSSDRKKSFKVDLELCGRKNAMEIDTGASKTILNEATYGRLHDALGPLQTSGFKHVYRRKDSSARSSYGSSKI